MSAAHASYQHVQPFTSLWLMLPTLVLSSTLPLILADGAPRNVPMALVLAPIPLLLLFLGRLVIEVRGEELRWGFGFVGWPRWRLPLAEIREVEVTRSRSLQGAGIKGSRRDRLYNASLGGPALKLALHDGRTITLGTPEPQRLAGFIRARLPRTPR